MLIRTPLVTFQKTPYLYTQRTPKEDPWTFIWINFFGLAVYYSLIYANRTKHPELKDDFRNEILYAMVESYLKHRHKPLTEQMKICKTIPFYYYGSKLDQKWATMDRVPAESVAIIEDEDKFRNLYDMFYEQFLDVHYKLKDDEVTDEKLVLMEILYPSKEFQKFLFEEKILGQMSKAMLRRFFHKKYKWDNEYFEQVFYNVRIAA